MRSILISILTLTSFSIFAQYPFEKYPSPTYQKYNNWKRYDWTDTKQAVHHTLKIDQFFDNKEALTIQLTSFTSNHKTSLIRVFRNNTQIQKIKEDMIFTTLNTGHEPIRVADINGDGLQDLKIITSYLGNGIAGLNVKIIYLFQTQNQEFIKVSFSDMIDTDRTERDFDGDGNFEIITMGLNGYDKHNYWTFNIFEYKNEELQSANFKDEYPIMIQYLYRKNYEITKKIDRQKMKEFALTFPRHYDKRN
ncbi:hypothetical protein [Tenacibaculum agarivorans]|uniref:hypothetical protein n=1 Tax=Tenacibaculum agarivorans TaxID=1908389 RepID=UPI00094B915B|nr:hypothetical protein [Tenacibaculum agarivorans]